LAIYKDNPFREKAKIIKKGMIKIKDCCLLINRCLIAGSSKYATAEVLPAKIKENKTDTKIFLNYFFV